MPRTEQTVPEVRIGSMRMVSNPMENHRDSNPFVFRLSIEERNTTEREPIAFDVTLGYLRDYSKLQDLLLRRMGMLLKYPAIEDMLDQPVRLDSAWRRLTNELIEDFC